MAPPVSSPNGSKAAQLSMLRYCRSRGWINLCSRTRSYPTASSNLRALPWEWPCLPAPQSPTSVPPMRLKRWLLATKSISYADPEKGGASGIHFAHVLERLGIVEEMKPKTKLVPGPQAPDLVARGEAEIGVTMVPEILPVPGVDYVGPLPQELQNKTDFVYVAGAFSQS